MEYAIKVEDLSKYYKGFQLDKVSFNVPKGCIMGLVGENGAGKSTILKSILNLTHMDGGTITVLDRQLEQMDSLLKEQIGVVFDESYFHDNLNLEQISKVMNKIYRNWNQHTFDSYAKKFKLPVDKKVSTFSRGMKMKLSISVALSHGAKLLVLDEATSGLDPIVRDEILDIFLDFIQNEEHTILISSHIISDLEKVADYITFIHDGKLVFSESKDNLIYNYGLIHCKKDEYKYIDDKYIVGLRKYQFGVEVLVNNKKEVEKLYRDFKVDSTTIEQIILMKVRGEITC